MPEELCLRRNVAPWDRGVRLAVVAAIIVGLPLVVRNPFGLIAGGILAGLELVAGLLGY